MRDDGRGEASGGDNAAAAKSRGAVFLTKHRRDYNIRASYFSMPSPRRQNELIKAVGHNSGKHCFSSIFSFVLSGKALGFKARTKPQDECEDAASLGLRVAHASATAMILLKNQAGARRWCFSAFAQMQGDETIQYDTDTLQFTEGGRGQVLSDH